MLLMGAVSQRRIPKANTPRAHCAGARMHTTFADKIKDLCSDT